MKALIAALCLMLGTASALAAAQLPDRIVVDGGPPATLQGNPLDGALADDRQLAERLATHLPKGMCTAAWRGYVAAWEVRDGQLFLVGIDASPCARATALALADIFPGGGERVAATWFTGRLLVTQARGAAHPYLVLDVDHGRVSGRETRDER